jgi:glutaredoxin-like protein NrdH
MNVVRRWNPACSFPTILVGGKCIVGFREEDIRRALGQ